MEFSETEQDLDELRDGNKIQQKLADEPSRMVLLPHLFLTFRVYR